MTNLFGSLLICFLYLVMLPDLSRAQQAPTGNDRAAQLQQADVASLQPDNDIYRLPWDTIMERDVLWRKRVWRDVDASKEMNTAFAPGENDLAAILLRGVLDGTLTAYDGKDGRFIKKADHEELEKMAIAGNVNCVAGVKKYKIKEDWLYVESKKRLVVRIVGLAPVVTITDLNGATSDQALFWIFYPDAREYLSGFKATATANWDQLFDSRNFGSHITQLVDFPRPPSHDR